MNDLHRSPKPALSNDIFIWSRTRPRIQGPRSVPWISTTSLMTNMAELEEWADRGFNMCQCSNALAGQGFYVLPCAIGTHPVSKVRF